MVSRLTEKRFAAIIGTERIEEMPSVLAASGCGGFQFVVFPVDQSSRSPLLFELIKAPPLFFAGSDSASLPANSEQNKYQQNYRFLFSAPAGCLKARGLGKSGSCEFEW